MDSRQPPYHNVLKQSSLEKMYLERIQVEESQLQDVVWGKKSIVKQIQSVLLNVMKNIKDVGSTMTVV